MALFSRSTPERDYGATPLSEWARTLKARVAQHGVNFFILYGPGVRDLHPLGPRRYGSIRDFLAESLFADRTAVILFDRAAGIRFTRTDAEETFREALRTYDHLHGTGLAQSAPRNPDHALQLIDSHLRAEISGRRAFSACVILDYADTIAPAGEPGQLSPEDRGATVTLRRWASDPLFLGHEVTFCAIAESTGSLNASLVADPRTFEIAVPVPSEDERYAFLSSHGATPNTFAQIDARRAAVLTAGLTRFHLHSILTDAESRGAPLDTDTLNREKRRLIEESSGGLLSFMASTVTLDAVAGHDAAKAMLRDTAQALRQGRLDVVPMGYLVCGPVGTGKSFLVRCFAAEIGVPVVELRNFRSMWHGQTEANLERILGILDALGPAAVVVDEADAALGSREVGGQDAGVSERVFATLAAFMGDTRRRGRVIWFLMTSRPDLVPVDLKRQGRAEEHIALFPPGHAAERAAVFEALRRRFEVPADPLLDVEALFTAVPRELSGADLEAVLIRARRRMAASGATRLTAELLRELIGDCQPPAYPAEIEYQKLLAAAECTSRRLLTPELAALSAEQLAQRLAELHATLRR